MSDTSDRLHAIAQITRKPVGSVPLAQHAREMADEVRKIFSVDACVIRLWEGEGLVLLASCGLPEKSCHQRLPVGYGISEEMVRNRRAIFIPDVAEHPATAGQQNRIPNSFLFTSYAGAPMLAGDRVIGILGLYTVEKITAFGPEDLDCVQIMANSMSVAIANDRVYEQLIHHRGQLESEIAARKQAEQRLAEMGEELVRVGRVAVMGELTATIAHELNQPLGAISVNASVCARLLNCPHPDLDEVRQALNWITRDAMRAAEVIRRVRDFLSRGQAERSPVDLNTIVTTVVELAGDRITSAQTELVLDLDPQLPGVPGDRTQLQQVVLNLLTNALDAVRPLEAARRKVTITSRCEGGAARVAVDDTGAGVAPEDLDRLFRPFFTTKPEGMGMGLPICRSIMEAHGGRLWVEPNPDGGARFQFTVPAAEDA